MRNRAEWEARGEETVALLIKEFAEDGDDNDELPRRASVFFQ